MTPNQAALSLANALETPGADFDALVAATELRRLVAENEALKKLPPWVAYDAECDVITIHGKRYSAGLFGSDGFCSTAGLILRIEQGPDEVVTATRLDANASLIELAEALESARRPGEHYFNRAAAALRRLAGKS